MCVLAFHTLVRTSPAAVVYSTQYSTSQFPLVGGGEKEEGQNQTLCYLSKQSERRGAHMNQENVGKKMVEAAQAAVPSTPLETVYSKLQQDEDFVILDIREPTEWINGHIKEAILLSRGLIEGRIENTIPDKDKTIFVH